MEKYNNTLQDEAGNIINTATITVYLANTGTTAALKLDDEVTAINNPFTVADANYNADGTFWFKAVNGDYDIKAVSGADEKWIYDITLFDSADDVAAISVGGTGQTTAQAAIDALTQVSAATNEHALIKDTATGNAVFKAVAVSDAASADIASAATINLTGAGNNPRITGTVATSAVTMNAGQEKTVVADGAWPLTYHATTNKLNGGVSYTCEAGDKILYNKDLSGVVSGLIIRDDGKSVIPHGFSESFTSAEQTITSAGTLTIAHGLSSQPKASDVSVYLVCKTAAAGYSIGDELAIAVGFQSTSVADGYGISLVPDATNVNIKYGSNASVFVIVIKNTGSGVAITNANWKIVVRALL